MIFCIKKKGRNKVNLFFIEIKKRIPNEDRRTRKKKSTKRGQLQTRTIKLIVMNHIDNLSFVHLNIKNLYLALSPCYVIFNIK